MSSIVDGYSEPQPYFVAIVPSCRALVIKLVQLVQCSLASSLARATARQQCLLRKESVISGRNVVSMFMDFSYTVPLQQRTSGITRLSPYVPPYLRILPLNALHIFASTANVTSRTQVAFLYWNSISGFSNLSDEGRLPWALSTFIIILLFLVKITYQFFNESINGHITFHFYFNE
ncbi:Hypothetical_protein [Hexamita inflata]|uniref:Hypothetical_protein n=1 Tax=Hexamita inflata TaxID=28002 RepID=A0ABP1GUD3_9EUKA